MIEYYMKRKNTFIGKEDQINGKKVKKVTWGLSRDYDVLIYVFTECGHKLTYSVEGNLDLKCLSTTFDYIL